MKTYELIRQPKDIHEPYRTAVRSKQVNFKTLQLAKNVVSQIESSKFDELDSTKQSAIYALRDLRKRLKAKPESIPYQIVHRKTGVTFGFSLSLAEPAKSLAMAVKNIRHEVKEHRRTMSQPYSISRWLNRFNQEIHTVGKVHVQPGTFLKLQKYKSIKLVYTEKRPTEEKVNYVGLELEFCAKKTKQELGEMLADAGLTNFVTLKGDGSVRPESGDHAHELCIILDQNQVRSKLAEIIKVLDAAGGYVNKTCGFHVHVDMRNRDSHKAFNNLVAAQGILYRMNPISRKKNDYCKPTRGRDLYKSQRQSRYKGVNAAAINRHNTIEVRIHAGTLNFDKIANWVDILLAVVDAPTIPGIIRSVKTLSKTIRLPYALSQYMMQRVKLFESQHKGLTEETEEAQAA